MSQFGQEYLSPFYMLVKYLHYCGYYNVQLFNFLEVTPSEKLKISNIPTSVLKVFSAGLLFRHMYVAVNNLCFIASCPKWFCLLCRCVFFLAKGNPWISLIIWLKNIKPVAKFGFYDFLHTVTSCLE